MQVEDLVCRWPSLGTEKLGQISERRAGRTTPGRMAQHQRMPTGRAHQAAGDLDQRGLAGPVRSEQTDELAFTDLDIDAAERVDAAVALRETGGGEGGRHGRSV